MRYYTKLNLCGLTIIYNAPTYYSINNNTVIMQDEKLDLLLILDKSGFKFKDFEDFKNWLNP